MLRPAVSIAAYLTSQPDASMQFFKEIWTLRGKLLASGSASAHAEVDLISKILFVRFLSDSGFFGANGFPFDLLKSDVPDFASLSFLDDKLGLESLPAPRSVKRDALARLIYEIVPRFNFSIVPTHSSPGLTAKPAVRSWILGYIYERWIDNRKTGSYFTADALAQSIVSHAVEEWLQAQYQNKFDDPFPLRRLLQARKNGDWLAGNDSQETLRWLEDALTSIRIVDLSMGGGAFLVAATRALYDLVLFCRSFTAQSISSAEHTALFHHIFRHNLYGVDILVTAIHIAKMRLWLASVELGNLPQSVEGMPALPNLIHGNALAAPDRSSSAMQTSFLYDESDDQVGAFLTTGGGFDVCVGNPPFIALSQRNHFPQKHAFIEDWNKRHPDYALRTTSDLSNFFILQGADVLRPNGVLAYITSRNFFDTRYGEPVRRFLTQEVELRNLFTLHDHPFIQQGLKVKANTVILSLIRRPPRGPMRFQDLTFWNEELSDQAGRVVDREELHHSSNWTQTLFQDPIRSDLQKRCPKRLGDYAIARMGIKSGDNSFFLLRADSDLYTESSRGEFSEIFIKIVRNSRDIRGFILPKDTQYRLLNLREEIADVERGFTTNRLKGIAKYVYQHGVAYSCSHCQSLAVKEHEKYPDRYPHRGMCTKCSECRLANNPCDRPVDRLSNQGHRPEWYTLSLGAPPAIAVQCIVDTEIGVFWNSANVYATDQFQIIEECSDEETTKLLFLFLCSRIARLLLEGSALHRARFDGSFMLKIQVNHLSDLPCPDFDRISPASREKLLSLFDRMIAVDNRRSDQAKALIDDVDRVFLETLGYSADLVRAIQVQLAVALEKAILFRWTKTRSRNKTQPSDEENNGDSVRGNPKTDLGISPIGPFNSDQEPTGTSGKQQTVGEGS